MEFIDYVRMLGRRWTWWVSILVVCVGLAFAYTSVAPKTYRATTVGFVACQPTGPDSNSAGSVRACVDTAILRMPSYAALIDAPTIATGVLEDVDVDLTAEQVTSRLKANHIPRTVILRVSATSSSPALAAELSNSAAKRLGRAIQNLETPAAGAVAPVRLVVTRPATPPGAPASPNRTLFLMLGVVFGLGGGLVAASLRDQALRTTDAAFGPVPVTPAAAAPAGPAEGTVPADPLPGYPPFGITPPAGINLLGGTTPAPPAGPAASPPAAQPPLPPQP